jgi:DNA polymerase (family 10)
MDNQDNQQFSAIFRDIASLLELQGDDPYRIRAYRRAAQTLASLSEPLRTIARRGALETLPSIGKTLSREIQELLERGRLRYYEYLITTIPEGILSALTPSQSLDRAGADPVADP